MTDSTASGEPPSLQELLAQVTWEDILADGIITGEEIDEGLRARGLDPEEYDYLYEG